MKKDLINKIIEDVSMQPSGDSLMSSWIPSYFNWCKGEKFVHLGHSGGLLCGESQEQYHVLGEVHRGLFQRLTCESCIQIVTEMNRRDNE